MISQKWCIIVGVPKKYPAHSCGAIVHLERTLNARSLANAHKKKKDITLPLVGSAKALSLPSQFPSLFLPPPLPAHRFLLPFAREPLRLKVLHCHL